MVRLGRFVSLSLLFPALAAAAGGHAYKVQENIAYADRPACRLDIRWPVGVSNFATVVNFHGGGLTGGKRHYIYWQPGKETSDAVAFVGVSYDFVTSVPPDTCIDDAAAAVAWTLKNVASYGGDPRKVFVTGISAGGYLTAMVGMDEKWLKPYGFKPGDLAGIAPMTGQMTKHFNVRAIGFKDKDPQYLPKIDDYAPLAFAARKGLPPACFLAGGRDVEWPCRVEENELLAASMRNLGYPKTEFHETEGPHGYCWPSVAYLRDFVMKTCDAGGVGRFADGERVVFLGDSITHGGWYVADLQLFQALRRPGSGTRIVNCGVAGDTAGGAIGRLEWEVLPLKPDRVFVMFGMNDIGRWSYRSNTTDAATLAKRETALAQYDANLRTVVGSLSSNAVKTVLMTATPYDQYTRPDDSGENLRVANEGLTRAAGIVRGLASERTFGLVDLHAPLTAMQRANLDTAFCGDRVHPDAVGHMLMFAHVVDAMAYSPFVAEVEIGGKTQRWPTRNCKVTDVARRPDGGLAFTYAPKSLPFPVTDDYRTAERFYPLTERLNRETFKIGDLADGDYDLCFDGRKVGTYTATELAAGINVATLETPNQIRAREAADVAKRLRGLTYGLRNLAVTLKKLHNAKIDVNDFAAVSGALADWKAKGRLPGLYGTWADEYLAAYPRIPLMLAEQSDLYAQLDAVRPAVSRVTVVPVARQSAAAEGDCLGGFGGSLEFPVREILFQPVLHMAQGRRFAVERPAKETAEGVHNIGFLIDTKTTGPYCEGTASFRQAEEGKIEGEWRMDGLSPKSQHVTLTGSFYLPRYENAVFSSGDRSFSFSSAAPFGEVFTGKVSSCRVADATGKTVVAISFPAPTRVELRKERDWGLAKYEVRLVAADDGVLKATFSGESPLSFREESSVTIRAGRDWIPLRASTDIAEGSPLDFTKMRGTDMPAGRHGRIVARDGHLEFEGRPGEPVRLYGVNVCGTGNVPDPETAKRFAANLRRIGYNAVRFHHHERVLVKPDAAHGSTELDPEAMARFDALVAACIENGLYMTTDLYVSRKPISYRSIGIDRDGDVSMDEYKGLVVVHEGAYSNFLAYARNFLGHVNPHTGRRYADEPAMSLLAFVNEGNLMCTWPQVRPLVPIADVSRPAIAEYERRFARRVTAFLRDEMKCAALTSNLSNYFWQPDAPGEVVRAQEYDYADDHFYIDHPRFLAKEWTLPSACPNTNPLFGSDRGAQRLTTTRVLGRPFTISEYNFSAPGRFRGVGGILTGALGARQDWSGLFRFAWTHVCEGLVETRPLGYFDMSGDPLGLAAERASICLFLRRDLMPAAETCAFVLPPEKAGFPEDRMDRWWAYDWAAWHVKLGTLVGDRAPAGVETLATYPEAPAADVAARLRAKPTGGVTIDSAAGSLVIDVPRTAGGFVEKGTLVAGPLRAAVGEVAATLWVSSLDGKPIADSSRLLLTHLTDVQNTETVYADAGRRILLDWGRLPHLMRAGRADVSLALAPGAWRVWALSSSGLRVRDVPCVFADGRLSFEAVVGADPTAATYLYELTR